MLVRSRTPEAGSHNHARVMDGHGLLGRPTGSAHGLDLCDHIHALDHLAEDHVPAVKPRCLHRRDEELRAVRVWPSICHAENAWTGVLQREVLVGELLAVDALTASAVAPGEVPSLDHEVGDDAVELAALVVKRMAGRGLALVTRAKANKVVYRLWHGIAVEADGHTLGLIVPDLNVEENLLRDRGILSRVDGCQGQEHQERSPEHAAHRRHRHGAESGSLTP
mmetsp:Transcript_60462/g.129689  ORF Transcript_60462/g.129689 Transcript_60462/m.129689 type:complete len:223 (-) Transcript_60462:13-681(-)